MEEQARLQASRSGCKGHITRLFNRIDELVDGEFDEYTITSLNSAINQLSKKMEKILAIDEQLLETFDNATELESAILDAEELQDDIVDKIARTQRYIELKSTKQPASIPHTTMDSQPIVTLPVNQPSVVTQSVISEGANNIESVSTVATTQDNDTLPPVTFTTAEHSIVGDTPIIHHEPLSPSATLATVSGAFDPPPFTPAVCQPLFNSVSTQRPLTTTPITHCETLPPSVTSAVSDAVGPPPLIPAVFQHSSSSVSSQRPLTKTVFAPKTLYQSPTSTHLNPLMPLSTHLDPSVQPFTPSNDAQHLSNSRLPKLSLPMFSGDPLTWQTFWESFYVSIHVNRNLSGIQKFTYLKAQLEGDAARAIKGLPLTGPNNDQAISLLHDRYAQPHKLVSAHMKALLEMPSPTNSLASLRIFYDSVESHIRGLSSLGKSEHSYGEILVPILFGKLSSDIWRNLACEHPNSQ